MFNFLAATVTKLDGGLFVFIGIIFIVAILSMVFFFVRNRNRHNPEECKCNCENCQNAKAECENAMTCENSGSCIEENENKDEEESSQNTSLEIEPKEEYSEELIDAYEALVGEFSEEKNETDPAQTWEGKDVKRDVMIELLKKEGVKGISKFSKAELRAKCIEMGIICPVK